MDIHEQVDTLLKEYEDRVVISYGATFSYDDEVYVARIKFDNEICGAISYESVEDALSITLDMLSGENLETKDMVDIRHIKSLKGVIDEIGFDRAVSILEQLR